MNLPWQVAVMCAAGYLIGGIPVGLLLVRWQRFGLDVRRYGSGNIGTSNVYRHAGFDVAVIVGPLQFAQGLVPVLVARLLGSIDLIYIWWMLSLAIGLGVLYRKRTGPIATTMLVIYVVIGLVIAAIKTAASGA